MEQVEIRKFTPADRDWIIRQHGTHYARAEGFDDSFGVLVGEIVDAFIAEHDPAREAGWIAVDGDERLGCIFCVAVDDDTAKLRLFLTTDAARGKGLGKRLLKTCMDFAQAQGYRGMTLWTHESHRAAGALYARTGWTLVSSKPVTSFGQKLVEQHWTITF